MNRTNHYPPSSESAAVYEERREEKMRELVNVRFHERRTAIIEGEATALRHIENDVLTFFADSGKLKELIKTALSDSNEHTGRDLLRLIKDVMYDDAQREIEAEFEVKPSRRPLGDSTVSALKAVEQALKGIKK